MLDVIPLNKRVIAKVLERTETIEKSASGLLIATAGAMIDDDGQISASGKKLKYHYLEVIAVDPQIIDILIGDLIYISKYSGDSYKEKGIEYHYIEYKDIIGKKKNG